MALRVLVTAAAALLLAASPAAAAQVRKGPAGTAFYTAPSPLPGAKHGDPIWARKLTGAPALSQAASNQLVLYRSTGVSGKAVAVSGTVSLPKGKAPKGGWPVITWAHGTSGIADRCAPSRDTASNPAHLFNAYVYPQLNAWLKAGYAVVRTDYEGLGTPAQVHPYLNGRSEGHSVLDMVRAARKLTPSLGKKIVIAGHSQGGQAALFAASMAKSWTPELTLRGTIAFAPVTHLSEQIPIARSINDPSPLSAYVAMISRGLDLARPALNIPSLFSDKATALLPRLDTDCLGQLTAQNEFGGLAPAEVFRADADLGPVAPALDAEDDAENLTIRSAVRIEQGTADTTVLPPFTDQTVQTLKGRGTPLVYKTYPGVDHGSIVAKAQADATSWIRSRLGNPRRSS